MELEAFRKRLAEIGREYIAKGMEETPGPIPDRANGLGKNIMAEVLRDYAIRAKSGISSNGHNGTTPYFRADYPRTATVQAQTEYTYEFDDGASESVEEPILTRDGQEILFSKVYESLGPKVYKYLYYHTGDHTGARKHLAEDLTQGAFERVLRKLGSFEDRGVPIGAWVFRIAHNCMVDHFRTPMPVGFFDHPERETSIQVLAPSGDRPDSDENIARIVVHELLDSPSLTDEQRRTIKLRFLKGYNTLETAKAMGKTVDAVKKLQNRGLANLRKFLTT